MKTYILSALLFASVALSAQEPVYLQINHLLGEEAFELNQAATAPDGYSFTTERLEYYLSGFKITHDGGQITDLPDLHHLVRPANENAFFLGDLELTIIESIEFAVGVGPAYNNEDPAGYPGSHPLAPKNPSMHWGWSSGYRFIAFEGVSGSGDFVFEIHALGNDSYYSQTLEVDAAYNGGTHVIVVDADYSQILQGIDLSSGGIFHSTLLPETIQTLENTRDVVFSAGNPSLSAQELVDTEQLSASIFPNPSAEGAFLNMASPASEDVVLTIVDVNGKSVYNETLQSQLTVLPSLASGLYVVQLHNKFGEVETLRWMVQ